MLPRGNWKIPPRGGRSWDIPPGTQKISDCHLEQLVEIYRIAEILEVPPGTTTATWNSSTATWNLWKKISSYLHNLPIGLKSSLRSALPTRQSTLNFHVWG